MCVCYRLDLYEIVRQERLFLDDLRPKYGCDMRKTRNRGFELLKTWEEVVFFSDFFSEILYEA